MIDNETKIKQLKKAIEGLFAKRKVYTTYMLENKTSRHNHPQVYDVG